MNFFFITIISIHDDIPFDITDYNDPPITKTNYYFINYLCPVKQILKQYFFTEFEYNTINIVFTPSFVIRSSIALIFKGCYKKFDTLLTFSIQFILFI